MYKNSFIYYFPSCFICKRLCLVRIEEYSFSVNLICKKGHSINTDVSRIKYKKIRLNNKNYKSTSNKCPLHENKYNDLGVTKESCKICKNEIEDNRPSVYLFYENKELKEAFDYIFKEYFSYKKNTINFYSAKNEMYKINRLKYNNHYDQKKNLIIEYLKKIYSLNFLIFHSIKPNDIYLGINIIINNYDYEDISKFPLIIYNISD